MQMLFHAMLVDALHAALEDRKEVFDRIGMNVATDVLAGRVLHALMIGKELISVAVEAAFISVKIAFARDVVGNNLVDGRLVCILDIE